MRISDWSSDVCSSDLDVRRRPGDPDRRLPRTRAAGDGAAGDRALGRALRLHPERAPGRFRRALGGRTPGDDAGLKAAPRAAWTGSRRSGRPLEWADSGPWPANNDPMQADILDALRRGANEDALSLARAAKIGRAHVR